MGNKANDRKIAVIGMVCRFPQANTVRQFWENMLAGHDVIRDIPPGRWLAEDFSSSNLEHGKTYSTRGGYLDNVDRFDASYFSISPREAQDMDPQQRILLELAAELFMQAGIPQYQLVNSDTGVFIGACSNDYNRLLLADYDYINSFTSTGTSNGICANRISYRFDLHGPSMVIDTACSSAMTALHLAVQALRAHQTQMSVVGGVNLLLTPDAYIGAAQAHMLAKDGTCKVFDAQADGFVRGEGCGLILLKRLEDAQRDKNPILAVISGSAINQDGLSNGLTAPNGLAHQHVMSKALEDAQCSPQEIDYVELHGTGTNLGDTIEINAMQALYGQNRSEDQAVVVGSVKSHIGHLEAAAGISSLIKTILCLQHGTIPANLNLHTLNPRIDTTVPMRIPQENMAWPKSAKRAAAVHCFGFGGSNAHVILEEAPVNKLALIPQKKGLLHFVVSAHSLAALSDYLKVYQEHLLHTQDSLTCICYTQQYHQNRFANRVILAVHSLKELQKKLKDKDYAVERANTDSVWPDDFNLAEHEVYIRASLPDYPWQRQSFWAPVITSEQKMEWLGHQVHPLLGRQFSTPETTAVFEQWLQNQSLGYLLDFQIHHQALFPTAAYLELMLSAVHYNQGSTSSFAPIQLKEFTLYKPLWLSSLNHLRIHTSLNEVDGKMYVHIYSQHEINGDWILHAQAQVDNVHPLSISSSFTAETFSGVTAVDPVIWEHYLSAQGITYEAGICLFDGMKIKDNACFATIQSATLLSSEYIAHPGIVEGALQSLFGPIIEKKLEGLFIPSSIESIRWYGVVPEKIHAYSELLAQDKEHILCNVTLLDEKLQPVAEIYGLTLQTVILEQVTKPSHAVMPEQIQVTETVQKELVNLLRQSPKEQRELLLKTALNKIAKEILGIPFNQDLDAQLGFFEMGMNSLMAMDFKDKLHLMLGSNYDLSNTLLFEQTNLQLLNEYLMNEVLADLFDRSPAIKPLPILNDSAHDEPVAIIGMACHFPGGANTLEDFWALLKNHKDGISEVPEDRWNIDAYYDADPDAPGKMNTRFGGFLTEDVSLFDAGFFSISPKEAQNMDPQQRLLLETTWQALEQGGISPKQLKNSQTGVYVGICSNDYGTLHNKYQNEAEINAYLGTGNSVSVAAGRIAFTLGLQGPTLSVDTACSSSLVAVHLACQALKNGEINAAIVGGVNLILTPENSIIFTKARMLAPDGHCKTFDAAADGYVRGEGCGVVLLKRLSDAKRDQDTVFAVIKGSAVNQDGASSGLTVPNGSAQEAVIRQALARAQVAPQSIDYIEAHGTGTKLGDPIEVRALGTVLGRTEKEGQPLIISSAKTYIGHLEAAAGIAGLIKTVLSMQHEYIPAHRNFNMLNPLIDLDRIPAVIPTEGCAWMKNPKRVRRAGVSSFGFSGTNAHVLLEEAPEAQAREEQSALPQPCLLVLSAKTRQSLQQMIASYSDYLATTNDSLADICYTAATGRDHFNFRVALLAKDKEDLLKELNTVQLVDAPFSDELVSLNDPELLATEYLSGKRIDWNGYYAPYLRGLRKINIPNYVFDTRSYWLDIQKTRTLPYGNIVHDLLGAKLPGHSRDVRFINQLDLKSQPYLNDHRIYGYVLFPGAGFVESALAGGVEILGEAPLRIDNFVLIAPLALNGITDYEVDFEHVEPSSYQGAIYSQQEKADWVQHVHFSLTGLTAQEVKISDLTELKASMETADPTILYQQLENVNLRYGKAFQSIKEAFVLPGKALVRLHNEFIDTKGYYLHPSLLDGVFQAVALTVEPSQLNTYIPALITSMTWYQKAGAEIWAEVTAVNHDAKAVTADMKIMDEYGVLLAEIKGFIARAASLNALERLIFIKAQPDAYIEEYQIYNLPVPTQEKHEKLVVFASDKAYVSLNLSGANRGNEQEDVTHKHIVYVYEGHFDSLVSFAQKLLSSSPLSFTLITRQALSLDQDDPINPAHTQALGFWKSLSQEATGFPCYQIDLGGNQDLTPLFALIREQALPEAQIILREHIYVPRLVTEEAYAQSHHQLAAPESQMYLDSTSGIDTLYWAARQFRSLGEHELKIRIMATSLNFRDVLKAMNLYPGDAGDFGYEAVGEVLAIGNQVTQFKPGDIVIALGQGLFAGEAVVNELQTARLPEVLSPVEGASIPITFLTAYDALNQLAHIKKGQAILIHAASGGVGLAAIKLAQLKEAIVYATASRPKHAYLKKTLGIKYVYDSRTTEFSQKILKDTEGKGVDIILNSLTGTGFIEASLACLKKSGTFLEIGKINTYTKEQMREVRPDVVYHLIELDKRMKEEPEAIQQELNTVLTLFTTKKLTPLPVTEFPVTEAVAAFHYLQAAKHIGKVVLSNPLPFVWPFQVRSATVS